ncbi:MAG: hypothetical protein A3J87_05915 [Sideroxydans sp. RIFOXYB12_FULL_59_6]|nr:MAG: hypothetical protein A3J87_05915 [Sideroxydans sp. RIFOXYB12_FULL_59_6]
MGLKLKLDELAPLLDRAAQQLDPDTLERLHSARRQALGRHRATAPAALLSRLHHLVTDQGHASHHHRALNWAAGLLLLAAVLVGGWHLQHTTLHDHAAIDLAILTDDLPLHMYVD